MLITFDGACEPKNPGGSMGWGIAVWNEETVTVEEERSDFAVAHPDNSNNVAEYRGLIMALEYFREVSAETGEVTVTIKGDSQLVIMQLRGEWRAKHGRYLPWYEKAAALVDELRKGGVDVRLEWIPREQNKAADTASTRALKERGITPTNWGARKAARR